MPRLSAWCVRAALVYLGLGFTLGATLLAGPALHLSVLLRLRPLHAEILLMGWMVQLALGVAYWILPRFNAGPARGREWVPWAAVLLLNAGIWAAGTGLVLGMRAVPLAGRAAETLAAVIFAAHLWRRVSRPALRNP